MLIQLEIISFILTLVLLQVLLVLYAWWFIRHSSFSSVSPAGGGGIPSPVWRTTLAILLAAWAALTVSLAVRSYVLGHVPFTDMYGFASSFCWGTIAVSCLFQWRLKSEVFGASGAVVAFALLIYAFTLPIEHAPLPPALQQTWLLPLHVSCAIMAYGMFALGFVSAVLFLVKGKVNLSFLPSADMLDRAGYLAVVTGFPLMTLVIIIGSIWAKIAWGTYWGWDPKETASLVTWLIYAGYLSTRLFLHWKNRSSALFLLIGFAAVLVTFFGNLFFGGLHSYAAP
jgi:cytochrome c-type biogenesis protein CcsB